MNGIRCLRVGLLLVVGLVCAGCDDSTSPLSDPQKATADARLVGVWRVPGDDGDVTYYHIGGAEGSLPKGVMRVVGVTHSKDGAVRPASHLLLFASELDKVTYLNVCDGAEAQVHAIQEKGWNAETVASYILFRYQVEGDKFLVRPMNNDAKQAAIEAKKIKGVVERGDFGVRSRFTDTTENLARFVAGAGDSLFLKDVFRLERVK